MFSGTSPETVSGKKLVYLFRVAEDSKTKSAGALAFTTENERTASKMLIQQPLKTEMFVHLDLLKLKLQVHLY